MLRRPVDEMGPELRSSWVVRSLEWRWWPVVLMLAAIAVSLPARRAGLLNDDYYQRALLIGPSSDLDRLSEVGLKPNGSGRLSTALFDQFVAVDPHKNLPEFKAYGALPWWTCNELRVAFWRPVASFTQWLDHRLFPGSLALMHLHSILWFAAAMLAIGILYRRLIPIGWSAGLAALLYLLADFSYFPTLWLANRNVLICLFFGVCTLILHHRGRARGSRFGRIAAPICLLLSLLSAEAGVATCAYLFAYEVLLRQDRGTKRLAALTPFVVVTVAWRFVYNHLGYGAGGGGYYFDPVREPLRYAIAVLDRAPFFLGGQWTTVPPELYCMVSDIPRHILWGVLALFAVAIPLVLWPLLRANRRARFWMTGMYLSALPVCATVPMSRALLFVALGAFGVIAEFVAGWEQRAAWVPVAGRRRILLLSLMVAGLGAHLPWAALRRVTVPAITSRAQRRMIGTMAVDNIWWWRHEDLILVNAPNPIVLLYDPYRNAYNNRLLPGNMRVLAPAYSPLEVTRTGPQRLVVRAISRSLLDCQEYGWMHFVFLYRALSDVRGPGQPLHVGQRIVLPRMTVEVTRVDERGWPVEAAFDFAVPLEDPSLQWLYWEWRVLDYAVFPLPRIGETVTLAGSFPL